MERHYTIIGRQETHADLAFIAKLTGGISVPGSIATLRAGSIALMGVETEVDCQFAQKLIAGWSLQETLAIVVLNYAFLRRITCANAENGDHIRIIGGSSSEKNLEELAEVLFPPWAKVA